MTPNRVEAQQEEILSLSSLRYVADYKCHICDVTDNPLTLFTSSYVTFLLHIYEPWRTIK